MININDYVFFPLNKKLEFRLWKRYRHSELDFVNELSTFTKNYSLNSIIQENQMIWKDENNNIHLILHFNIKAFEINKILQVYEYSKNYTNIQNFILVDQTKTPKQAYDIFRLNRLSFMQHCNHFPISIFKRKGDNNTVTQSDFFSFFNYLKTDEKLRWGNYIANQETVKESFEKECKKNNLNQIVEGDYIYWINELNEIECQFLIVYDPSNIDTFINLYSNIIHKNIKLTFCIINQVPDGENKFDIFRLSEQSYLEHCNRVALREEDLC